MRYKVISIVLVMIICFVCGCESDNKKVSNKSSNVLKCTRTAVSQGDISTSLKYSIYYSGEYVTKTVSIEKITSDNDSVLEQYKEAYEKVFEGYKDIPYYDNKVEKYGDTVTSTTVIDYLKVDTKLLLEIEGEEGNIYDKDGKVRKETLVNLYKKYGAKCE